VACFKEVSSEIRSGRILGRRGGRVAASRGFAAAGLYLADARPSRSSASRRLRRHDQPDAGRRAGKLPSRFAR
jgi:hypothetical protein